MTEEKTKGLKEEGECCPACTSIQLCRAYNENGETRFPQSYKWSDGCCEKCSDVTCLQNPFYILSLNKGKNDMEIEVFLEDYRKEALSTILKY